jgi:hypothetical protein
MVSLWTIVPRVAITAEEDLENQTRRKQPNQKEKRKEKEFYKILFEVYDQVRRWTYNIIVLTT